jgi:hypothetical protein
VFFDLKRSFLEICPTTRVRYSDFPVEISATSIRSSAEGLNAWQLELSLAHIAQNSASLAYEIGGVPICGMEKENIRKPEQIERSHILFANGYPVDVRHVNPTSD